VKDCCLTSSEQYFSHIMARKSYILMRWWCPLCTRTRGVGYSVLAMYRSLEQLSSGRHAAPLGHIVLIQPVLALSP